MLKREIGLREDFPLTVDPRYKKLVEIPEGYRWLGNFSGKSEEHILNYYFGGKNLPSYTKEDILILPISEEVKAELKGNLTHTVVVKISAFL